MDCSHIAVRFLSGSPQLQSSPPTRAVLGLGVFWDPTRARSKEALEALALTSFWPPSLQQSACNPSWSQNLPACQASCHGGGCGGSLLIQADVGRGSQGFQLPVQLAHRAPQVCLESRSHGRCWCDSCWLNYRLPPTGSDFLKSASLILAEHLSVWKFVYLDFHFFFHFACLAGNFTDFHPRL